MIDIRDLPKAIKIMEEVMEAIVTKEYYHAQSIDKYETKEWILKKHYAHRMPSVSYAFGLYHGNILEGVCTFGMSPNYAEMLKWKPFDILELNRLVINDTHAKNALSFFVSQCLKKLPHPIVVISYSDLKQGHHGYIYQATNWIYTGIGGEGHPIYIMKDGTERHSRHETDIDKNQVKRIEKTIGKARYYYFLGTKKEKKEMLQALKYPILPYPKGDNKRYDASYQPDVQLTLC